MTGTGDRTWRLSVKVGDLVRYVGSAAMYCDRVGVVTKLFACIDERIDAALVHFVGLEGKGRDATGVGQVQDGLHPMGFDELWVFTPEDACL